MKLRGISNEGFERLARKVLGDINDESGGLVDIECINCDGTGVVLDNQICPACDGAGLLEVSEEDLGGGEILVKDPSRYPLSLQA